MYAHDLNRCIRWTLEWGPSAVRRRAVLADRPGPDDRLRIGCEVGVRQVRLPQLGVWTNELGHGCGDVASDSDWGQAGDLLSDLGVPVQELCQRLPWIQQPTIEAGAP